MSAEQIAERTTLLPYFQRYLPAERAEQCLRTMCSYNTRGLQFKLGIAATSVRPPKFLRFCLECRTRDMTNLGETYWRRTHQLTGCHVCPDHGCLLRCSNVTYELSQCLEYADATEQTTGHEAPPIALRDEDVVRLTEVASRCQAILIGEDCRWPPEGVLAAYVEALVERGFTNREGGVAGAKVLEALTEFYGARFLDGIGMPCIEARHWWLPALLNNGGNVTHPARHAIFQIFLENTPPVRPVHPFRRGILDGPWRCPNPYVEHVDEFPIKEVELKSRHYSKPHAIAECTCGFKFIFQSTHDDDPRMPVVIKRLAYGPSWEAEAKRQRTEGRRLADIRRGMEIGTSTLMRFLGYLGEAPRPINEQQNSKGQSGLGAIEQRIVEPLALNEECVKPTKEKQIVECGDDAPLSRQMIGRSRRYDGGQLRGATDSLQQKAKYREVDWDMRDEEWAVRLQSASVAIKGLAPLKQASAKAIVKMALGCNALKNLKHLPRCARILRELVESVDAFRARRLRSAATEFHDKGLPCTRGALLRHCSLYGKKLGPELMELIELLVAGGQAI